ncbi:hypothetical protein ACVXG9_03770 [Escherichia coli]
MLINSIPLRSNWRFFRNQPLKALVQKLQRMQFSKARKTSCKNRTADPRKHRSESAPLRDRRKRWVSNMTGTAIRPAPVFSP